MNKEILKLIMKVAEASLKIVEIYDGEVKFKSTGRHYAALGRRQMRHINATRRLKRALRRIAKQRKEKKRGRT